MNRMKHISLLCMVGLVAFCAKSLLAGDEDLPIRPCGVPPPAPPQFHAGGEGTPPLPLPATPLRRSEKKKPPSPPTAMAKLQLGKYESWNSDPGALVNLMNRAGSVLSGARYTFSTVGLENFSYDPKEVPVLYFGATESFSFPPEACKRLHEYCEKGGTLFFEANSGFDAARTSFTNGIKAIFPDKVLRRLPLEHPVFHSNSELTTVRYMKTVDAVPDDKPYLEGVDLGTRTVCFYSRYGLGCAWDGHSHPKNRGLGQDSALAMGINVLAYSMSEQNTPKPLAETIVYAEDPSEPRTRVAVAQLVHNGEWNATPAGVAALLQQVVTKLNIHVQYQTTPVSLAKDDVTGFPLLFASGMYDFTLNDQEVAALRAYLQNGGFLFAESCAGRESFEKAFRREMKKVFPDRDLQKLELADPVYSTFFHIGSVNYDQRLAFDKGNAGTPGLEGIRLEGRAVVVFSKFGLSTGWEGNASPFNYSLAPDDAVKVGLNVIAYAMTH